MEQSVYDSKRVIVAVSGTIQDGFELRKNIDYRHSSNNNDKVVEAVFLGWAMVRGVKMYFDVKDESSREYDPKVPHRVNPAMVLTGDASHANRYALYIIDERACLEALLGEPRLLTMAPDAVRIDLDDPLTSPDVASLARAMMEEFCTNEFETTFQTDQCACLAVVACYKPRTFIAAPPFKIREDGTEITSFQESLASFAGINTGANSTDVVPGSIAWNQAVASALQAVRVKKNESIVNSNVDIANQNDYLYGTTKTCFRLSRRMAASKFNLIAQSAGLSLRL